MGQLGQGLKQRPVVCSKEQGARKLVYSEKAKKFEKSHNFI